MSTKNELKIPKLERQVAAVENKNEFKTTDVTSTSELSKKFPKLTRVLNVHIDKVNNIVSNEFKAHGPGLLQINFTEEKKDNVKINYVPRKYYNEHAPESQVTKFLNSITMPNYLVYMYICANENKDQIFLRIPKSIPTNASPNEKPPAAATEKKAPTVKN